MNFWEICEEDINRCCFGKYDSHRATNAIYRELDKLFEGPSKIRKPRTQKIKDQLQFYMFYTIEDPSFSIAAKVGGKINLGQIVKIKFIIIYIFISEVIYCHNTIIYCHHFSGKTNMACVAFSLSSSVIVNQLTVVLFEYLSANQNVSIVGNFQ